MGITKIQPEIQKLVNIINNSYAVFIPFSCFPKKTGIPAENPSKFNSLNVDELDVASHKLDQIWMSSSTNHSLQKTFRGLPMVHNFYHWYYSRICWRKNLELL